MDKCPPDEVSPYRENYFYTTSGAMGNFMLLPRTAIVYLGLLWPVAGDRFKLMQKEHRGG